MIKRKKIVIVGAGPGGLAAGMILAHHGHEVQVYEKNDRVGGRNAPLRLGDFTFETGPTFVMLPQVFEEVFALAGRQLKDYVDMQVVDPLYRLRFADGRDFFVPFDKKKLGAEIERLWPGELSGYKRWLKAHQLKFKWTYVCLQVPYNKFYHYLRFKLLRALLVMQNHLSVYGVLKKIF